MTSRDFCFWLQGFFEVNAAAAGPNAPISSTQADCIRKHLALAFKHEIDPSMGGPEHQADLNKTHDPLGHLKNQPPGGPLLRC